MGQEILKISVIIPTYKRPQLLQRALDSLREQTFSDGEILVVDNEANVSVESLISKVQPGHRLPIRYVAESNLGLHHARHAGARAARGEILLFSDDDATFDRGWMSAYAESFDRYPEMAAAGGPVRPLWEGSPPQWLLKLQESYGGRSFPMLSLMERGPDFCLAPQGVFFGVNMAIRKSVLFEVGGFNPEAFGEVWLGDGESGLNYKLWDRRLPIGYVPGAVVHHYISAERMTVDYLRRRMANEGACAMYTRFHREIPGTAGFWWCIGSLVVKCCLSRFAAILTGGRTDSLSLKFQLHAAKVDAQLRYARRLRRDEEFRTFVRKQNWLNDPCTSA
jgi:glucosyl-dolichyl phosphate glucuronosyltransferase